MLLAWKKGVKTQSTYICTEITVCVDYSVSQTSFFSDSPPLPLFLCVLFSLFIQHSFLPPNLSQGLLAFV